MSQNVLVQLTLEHFNSVRRKDLDAILGLYAQSNDLLVFVEGPRWQTLGYDNVKRGWTDFVASPITMIGCEWSEHLKSKIVGKMGFVAGITTLDLEINGEPKTIKFRGTFVFEQNEADDWKVVLEHFSQPAADPYGIGDWLKV
jgi:ketosteroid isomerase-like protein